MVCSCKSCASMLRKESMLTSFLHSITDDEGNAWQTPQSDEQDPQVRLQYVEMCFPASLR